MPRTVATASLRYRCFGFDAQRAFDSFSRTLGNPTTHFLTSRVNLIWTKGLIFRTPLLRYLRKLICETLPKYSFTSLSVEILKVLLIDEFSFLLDIRGYLRFKTIVLTRLRDCSQKFEERRKLIAFMQILCVSVVRVSLRISVPNSLIPMSFKFCAFFCLALAFSESCQG